MTKFIEMLSCSNKRVISYQIFHFMYFCKNMNQTFAANDKYHNIFIVRYLCDYTTPISNQYSKYKTAFKRA